jgi:hypothetical protein
MSERPCASATRAYLTQKPATFLGSRAFENQMTGAAKQVISKKDHQRGL